MEAPFSFEGANQKDDRNFHYQVGGVPHQPNIHCSLEGEELQLDDDVQMVKVLAMVNNLHENEEFFQELSVAYPMHRKGEFHHL